MNEISRPSAVTAREPRFVLQLHAEARVELLAGPAKPAASAPPRPEGAAVLLKRTRLVLDGAGAALAVSRLASGPAGEAAVRDAFFTGSPGDFFGHLRFLHRLGEAGCLDRIVLAEDGAEIARLVQLAGVASFDARAALGPARIRLSRFAGLRRDGARLVMETPLGTAKVVFAHAAGLALLQALAEAVCPAALAEIAGMEPQVALGVATLLVNAGLAGPVDAVTGRLAEETAAASGWEFHDLLFHQRSRLGRHGAPYGGTFHRKGLDAPPSLLPPWPTAAGPEIALASPADEAGPGLFEVLAARRSVRDYDEAPMTAEDLGGFLHRSARIQRHIETPDGDMDYSFRPHPGGGAIHELTIYPVIAACPGLPRGVYRYDPLRHVLRRLEVAPADVDHLLEMAWITADRKSRPQVFLALTAFVSRFQWKYQSMAYAAILKNVGALYQTFYLAATAMNLAPCALGGGDSAFFARALGLDPEQEPAVGEFVLGARRRS